MRRAVHRLWRVGRLRELGAPSELIGRSERLVAESRASLDESEWQLVLLLLPAYRAAEEAKAAWHARCESCAHRGLRLDADGSQHCRRYAAGEITCPDPCPAYKEDVPSCG